METKELLLDDILVDYETIKYLDERLSCSGIYIAINDSTKEGYVGKTEGKLKDRIRDQISSSHNPEVCKLFNNSNTRLHIITFEPILCEYLDFYLYKDITWEDYRKSYSMKNNYDQQLKGLEYEVYRFIQSKGFKMLNKKSGFASGSRNDYKDGYSEEFMNLYEDAIKKDNVFDCSIKNHLFPNKNDERFINLKMRYLDLQIEFKDMEKNYREQIKELEKRICDLEEIEGNLNTQLYEVNELDLYLKSTGNTVKKIELMQNSSKKLEEENKELRAKLKQIKAILK